MLDRSREASSPRWMRAYAPLVGAAVALVAAGWFTYAGIDYARNGCGCRDPLFPDWIWVVMLGVAVPFYAVAFALVVRVVTARRAAGGG
jgi:hypothetical protein